MNHQIFGCREENGLLLKFCLSLTLLTEEVVNDLRTQKVVKHIPQTENTLVRERRG